MTADEDYCHQPGICVSRGCWVCEPEAKPKRRRRKNNASLADHIKSNVAIDDNGCWIWQRYCKPSGYAAIGVDCKSANGHRVSYEVFVGPIPEGLQIDHLCRVRSCVNPDHLEPVTAKVNTLRGEAPSAIHARKTECHKGHPFDAVNTRVDPKTGARICRACTNEREQKRRNYDHSTCRNGHPKTEENTYYPPNGNRPSCLICVRAGWALQNERRKAKRRGDTFTTTEPKDDK